MADNLIRNLCDRQIKKASTLVARISSGKLPACKLVVLLPLHSVVAQTDTTAIMPMNGPVGLRMKHPAPFDSHVIPEGSH